MTISLHARYEFVDESSSRSETRVRLNHNSPRAENAALALASALSSISDAALTKVSLLYRHEIPPYEPPAFPFPVRTRVGIKGNNDAYHALLPTSVDGALQIAEFLRDGGFCTASGDDFINKQEVEPVEPNWRSVEWGGASQRYILVLDEQLWRDLLITSMSLDSVSRRDGVSALTGALLRKQVYELLRGVRLEEILERLDEIIAILRSRAENDNSLFAQIDDVEELLNLIISLI